MAETRKNPAAGAANAALLAARNKKIMTAIGAALIAIGIAGMVTVGSQAIDTLRSQGFGTEQGKSFQLIEYVFMFTMIAGLALVIYAQVGAQRGRAKQRRSS